MTGVSSAVSEGAMLVLSGKHHQGSPDTNVKFPGLHLTLPGGVAVGGVVVVISSGAVAIRIATEKSSAGSGVTPAEGAVVVTSSAALTDTQTPARSSRAFVNILLHALTPASYIQTPASLSPADPTHATSSFLRAGHARLFTVSPVDLPSLQELGGKGEGKGTG
ncbi:hypothetical protein E2C01_061622 [Portunus trituberculatus]|uniref:Uncharacterized protein n=1 Tax=Portunus trituberculatus TaxID=210409 RepID=A0A5B7HCW4_PORTR|nr:hypothetical protein [Portunus trituberculatus]